MGLASAGRLGNHDPWQIVSFAIFGGSLILLYSASATYHLLNVSTRRVAAQARSHNDLRLIAEPTPRSASSRHGPGDMPCCCHLVIGCCRRVFKVFYLNAPRWAYTGIYLLMGWICVFAIVPLARTVGLRRLVWLFAGGVFYSVGAVIYGLRRPNLIPGWLGFHEIFHILIILGSLSHFYFVYLLA